MSPITKHVTSELPTTHNLMFKLSLSIETKSVISTQQENKSERAQITDLGYVVKITQSRSRNQPTNHQESSSYEIILRKEHHEQSTASFDVYY